MYNDWLSLSSIDIDIIISARERDLTLKLTKLNYFYILEGPIYSISKLRETKEIFDQKKIMYQIYTKNYIKMKISSVRNGEVGTIKTIRFKSHDFYYMYFF